VPSRKVEATHRQRVNDPISSGLYTALDPLALQLQISESLNNLLTENEILSGHTRVLGLVVGSPLESTNASSQYLLG